MSLESPTSWSRPLSRALLLVTGLLTFLHVCGPVTTNDLFWHIKTGEHLWNTGGFSSRDVFSYTTEDLAWIQHEWLSQLIFYGLHELGGFTLLRLFAGVAALLIGWLIYILVRRELGSELPAAILVVVFAVLATERFQTRPTLFSMGCFILMVTWLSGRRGEWRWREGLALVSLTLVWVNLHSVGLLSLPIYGTYLAGLVARRLTDRAAAPVDLRRHGLTFLGVLAACCMTPTGLRLFAFAAQDGEQVMNLVVDEWGAFSLTYSQNPLLSPLSYGVILVILACILVVYLRAGVALSGEPHKLASPGFPDPLRLAMLVLCLVGGLSARRFHWMLVISLALALAHLLKMARHRTPSRVSDRHLLPKLGISLSACLLFLHYQSHLHFEGKPLHGNLSDAAYYTGDIAPSLDLGGIRFMQEAGLEGNAFCHYSSGGMLTYALHPRIKVFVDSRADLYRREVILDFLRVRDGHPDQQAILDRYDTDIYYRHWEINPLREPIGWTKVYSASDGEVWLRNTPQNEQNLHRSLRWQRLASQPAAPGKR